MVYKIEFTIQAQREYQNVIRYLVENWGEFSVHKFREKLQKKLKSISNMPTIGTMYCVNRNMYRTLVVTKQNTLIYSIEGHIVNILKVFDNRQNPNKKYQF